MSSETVGEGDVFVISPRLLLLILAAAREMLLLSLCLANPLEATGNAYAVLSTHPSFVYIFFLKQLNHAVRTP